MPHGSYRAPDSRPMLFFCCAPEDHERRRVFAEHLHELIPERFVAFSEDDVPAGADRDASVADALERAKVIVLLVSSDLLSTARFQERELPIALRRHAEGSALVIPVILRACRWEEEPFARLGVLPRDRGYPAGRVPLYSAANVDEAFSEVARDMRQAIDAFLPPRPWSPGPPAPPVSVRPYPEPGPLNPAPVRPSPEPGPRTPEPAPAAGGRAVWPWVLLGLLSLPVIAGGALFVTCSMLRSGDGQGSGAAASPPSAGGTIAPEGPAPPKSGSPAQGGARRPLAEGDVVIARYGGRSMYSEGTVKSVTPTRVKVAWSAGWFGSTSERPPSEVLPAPTGSATGVAEGQYVLGRKSTTSWEGALVTRASGEMVAVKYVSGATASLGLADVLVVPPALAMEFAHDDFERTGSKGSPPRPAGWQPKPGDAVVARRDSSWHSAVVKSVDGEKVFVVFTDAALAYERPALSVAPDRPPSKPPEPGRFVIMRPPTGLWVYAKVTGGDGQKVDVALADGSARTLAAAQYLPLE